MNIFNEIDMRRKLNKNLVYKFEYDKYKINGIYSKINKQDIDYIIKIKRIYC